MAKKNQPSFAKGELSSAMYSRVDTAAYQVGLRTALNGTVLATGGFENRSGLIHIGPVKDHSYAPRLIPFEFKTTDSHMLEFGDQYIRVMRGDDYVKEATKAISGATKASIAVLTVVGHGYTVGQDIYVAGVSGMTELNNRWFKVYGVVDVDNIQLAEQYDETEALNSSAYGTYVSGGTAARVYEIASPYDIEDIMQIGYTQSADVLTLTHPNYAARELSRAGLTSWSLGVIVFAPSIAAPSAPTVSPNTTGSATYSYVVTAENDAGEESLASAATTITNGNATADNQITWTAVTGARVYNVYKKGNGLYGFIGRTETPVVTFRDNNLKADEADAPYTARDPISAAGDYPGASGYYEQRRVFGGSDNKPDTSYYTVIGSQKNMSVASPGKDDDAITATLPATKVNQIRHYVPINDLLVFTSGSEWRVNSGQDSAFSSATIKQKPQTYWGCSYVKPMVVGSTVVFGEENNVRVRTAGFNLQIDGYESTDMNLLADHIFRDAKIVDGAMAKIPHNVCFFVREDGYVAACTFQQQQEVLAWTRLNTQGWFERVATLRRADNEPDDRAYFVVQRNVGGRFVRSVERLASRRFTDVRDCFFVDNGLSYDAPIDIAAITLGSDITVETDVAHGLANGDQVDLSDIVLDSTFDEDIGEYTEENPLNNARFKVSDATSTTFKLKKLKGSAYVDGSELLPYIEGGKVRKAVSTVSGLWHLEGRRVVCLADGNVVRGLTVEDGQISFDRRYSRVHVGLPYVSELATLALEIQGAPTLQGRLKTASKATVRFERSRGLIAKHFDAPASSFIEVPQRQFEGYGEPTALLTGDLEVVLGAETDNNASIICRQKDPLPMTILAVVTDLEVEDITNAQ
jgi:hypothetical protein